MPHRIAHASTLFNDALALVAVFVANASASLTDAEGWAKAIGPYGGYFISLVMLALFIQRDRSATKTAERRHAETISMQKANADQLMALTVEGIKAQGKVAMVISNVDHTLQSFQQSNDENTAKIVTAMNSKTCHAKTIKELFPNFPDSQ